DRQRRYRLRHGVDATDDRSHRRLVDHLGQLLDGLGQVGDRDLILTVTDVVDVYGYALRDTLRLGALFVDQAGQTSTGALTDDDDASAADGAVHGFLRLRIDSDRGVGCLPLAPEA